MIRLPEIWKIGGVHAQGSPMHAYSPLARKDRRTAFLLGLAFCGGISSLSGARAETMDLIGPPGSVAFGTTVAMLPNGNIVVADPWAGIGARNAGAVHLYTPAGVLISTLRGSRENDRVGTGIFVLANGHFVVVSSVWNNGSADNAGAVTWVDGDKGLSGVVSPDNSLVGTQSDDLVGGWGVTALSGGNYVVSSPLWSNGSVKWAGAVTWADGSKGLAGAVSVANSLVGQANDQIGYSDGDANSVTTALPNGNYVVVSTRWNNGSAGNAGAVTWGDGRVGIRGVVSTANSLTGTQAGDRVGVDGVTILANGNYVVTSPQWNNSAGAATWADGNAGRSGPVSTANSLTGKSGDSVGSGGYFTKTTALSNGNYVVVSPGWSGSAELYIAGAVTWGDGKRGTTGEVSARNSLIGADHHNAVGHYGVAPLSNGNYVVVTEGLGNLVSAATWVDGRAAYSGVVSDRNSLLGGLDMRVTALANGNYVVKSDAENGSVTWANGATGLIGRVSQANSLHGTGNGAQVTALSNGNYVISSPHWNPSGQIPNIGQYAIGAVTWADGMTQLQGEISPSNSLLARGAANSLGSGVAIALANGHYLVSSPYWSDSSNLGALTWVDGRAGLIGIVSPSNSMTGSISEIRLLGNDGIIPLADGNYLLKSVVSNTATTLFMTLMDGSTRHIDSIRPQDSIAAGDPYNAPYSTYTYDVAHKTLLVGCPSDNRVSLQRLEVPPSVPAHSMRPLPPQLLLPRRR